MDGWAAGDLNDTRHLVGEYSLQLCEGEFGRRETLLFNGYVDSLAGLYTGMDFRVYY